VNEIDPAESGRPASVELRFAPRSVASRVVGLTLLAAGASLLVVFAARERLLHASLRFGEAPLVLVWALGISLAGIAIWGHLSSFVLRADDHGVYRAAGWFRRSVNWCDVITAFVDAPASEMGQEWIDGLSLVLRDSRGRELMRLGHDLGCGAPAEQAAFKRFIRAQLSSYQVTKEGSPLAWINWG
jgi:hypothetical protein